MRYALSDYEWTAIKPLLPNKPRGVRRVNDRRVLSGIFWVLRSGAPWRDLPENYGPRTTCYNRFVRWRRAGVWDRIMDALAAGHDASCGCTSRRPASQATISKIWVAHAVASPARFMRSSTPMVCRSISPSRRVRLMTVDCVRFFSARCFHERCCSRIGDTTRTGSGSLPVSKAHGRTFRRNAIAKTRSVSAHIFIAHATWSNGSSIRSSNVGVSRPIRPSRPTTWHSSSSHQSASGCVLMSPRPREAATKEASKASAEAWYSMTSVGTAMQYWTSVGNHRGQGRGWFK